ncbi:MAG: hybrid sensor histidine kinase/response regulator [Planctomycetota bacterium]|nr:MAG: hybrid sensor histidine kinase/response regulator [Planctomycetota bacterium]
MPAADLHPQEPQRLAELRELEILDSDPEAAFDSIVRLASWIAGTPISLLSLLDDQRQWFKARWGLDVCETHRDEAFCAYAILDSSHILEIPDAREDERFKDNPLVCGAPHIRFYAGVPLRGPSSGLPIGTLCVISSEPYVLRDDQRVALQQLALQAEQLIAFRRAALLLRQQNQALHQVAVDRSRLLATISHDTRTPLTSILGVVELLQQQSLPEQSTELLATLDAASTSLNGLLTDLGELARCEDGAIRLQLRPWDPAQVAHECMRIVSVFGREKGLHCHVRIEDTVPQRLRGDPDRVRQIIVNILANAVKFCQRGEVLLALSWRADEEELHIVISDDGPGMEAEQAKHIFKPYTQVHDDASMRAKGSGLGLTIVRHLVDLMQGSITVESTPEKGTQFSLAIPFSIDEGTDRKQRPKHLPQLTGLRCLVVDDDVVSQNILVALLHSIGCLAEAVASGEECLARHADYEVILMDQNMPRLSGSEVCQRIREQEVAQGCPPKPICAISGDANIVIGQFSAVLVKPIRLKVLHETIAAISGRTST